MSESRFYYCYQGSQFWNEIKTPLANKMTDFHTLSSADVEL